MYWKNLSNEAKSVIEWVENPYTNRRETIKIEVGGYFTPIREVNILITEELFKEILSWVESDKELIYNYKYVEKKLTFRLRDGSCIKLY